MIITQIEHKIFLINNHIFIHQNIISTPINYNKMRIMAIKRCNIFSLENKKTKIIRKITIRDEIYMMINNNVKILLHLKTLGLI